jgi:hypothetical protein
LPKGYIKMDRRVKFKSKRVDLNITCTHAAAKERPNQNPVTLEEKQRMEF